jgi:hypothetical protein
VSLLFRYTRPHALDQLHRELLDAGVTVERLEGDAEGRLWITVPDGTEEPDVAIVVERHTPRREYDVAARREEVAAATEVQRRRAALRTVRQAVAGATDLGQLRAATSRLLDIVEGEAG